MGEQTVKIPTMWNIKQAAEKTGLSQFTINQLVKTQQIKSIRVGAGQRGKILVNAASLCEYMRGSEQV